MVGVSCRVWCVGVVSFVVLDVLGVLVFKFGAFWCVGVVSSSFRRVGSFWVCWCMSSIVVFGAVVWCLEVFVIGCLSLLCWWCLQVFVVLDAFGVVSSSFRRVWCLCCVRAVSLSFSLFLVPFWCVCVLVCLQVFVVLDAFWCWCGVFKFVVVFGAFWCVGVVSSSFRRVLVFGA